MKPAKETADNPRMMRGVSFPFLAEYSRAFTLAVVALLGLAFPLPGMAEELSGPGRPGAATEPVRALWIVRDALTSPASIRRAVDDAANAGITDLLVQVRGRGDAYYPSQQTPVSPLLENARRKNAGFDPLGLFCELAHTRGMRVHAWLNVYLVWSRGTPPDGHVLRLHPEWVTVNVSGIPMDALPYRKIEASEDEGSYLEPGNREVVAHLNAVVDEILARYPVDGIHLDYVRYPRMDVGYSEVMRAGFRRKTGVDPLDLEMHPKQMVNEHGQNGFLGLARGWRQFKADQVTALVRTLRTTIEARRPGTLLTAAVRPDPDEALLHFGQDWVRWVNEGWVDAVAPMMYSTSATVVSRQARTIAERVPPERVWAGIAVYNQSVTSAAAKIESVHKAGIGGISIFSYNSMPGGGRALAMLTGSR